jgi:RimJ/RimL family protein N-acetyltransferase
MYKTKKGEIFNIRHVVVEDATKLIEYVNLVSGESDNLTFGEGEFGMTVEQEEAFIRSYDNNDNACMFIAVLEDEIIGQMSYAGGRRARVRHCGEFGITVKKKYWHQGVGHIMLNYLIKWCEESTYCEKLNLRVREDNIKAIGLYKKLGFEEEGLLINDMKINGEFVNCLFMGKMIK